MKVIELSPTAPNLDALLEAARQEDILLVRDGRPLVRLERFDEEDWEDWKYETSLAGQERGRHAREQYARGDCKTLEQVKQRYGLKKDDQAT